MTFFSLQVYTRQVELNTRVGAWSSVEQELDAHLLSSLMWSWIEHLSKPVLSPADVKKLMTDSRPDLLSSTATDVECPDPMLLDDALVNLGKVVCFIYNFSDLILLSVIP